MSNETYTSSGTEPLIERLRRATIGRYDIYAELGTGGMASVFLALDLALDRKVAIKVMSPAMSASPDNIERFKREAKVSASLNHPHIIGIFAVGDDPDLAYFVMKYIEGRALDSVIRESGAQSVPFVQTIIGAAGKALHYAHSRGVVHRDVKPANFMLDQDGWLIVTDFGIAKLEDTKGLTMTGSIIGTPYYMSPEQFNGKAVTGATDQYALGIVAYELLTGKQPYTGDTIVEVMRGHLFDEVPSVRAEHPEIPEALDACIQKMLSKDPNDRYASLEDAVAAFGAVPPKVEAEVRTQIISLAKIGAKQQPRMSVPVSPIPAQRPRPATPAGVGGAAGGRASGAAATEPRRPRAAPARNRDDHEDEAPKKSSAGKIFVALLVVVLLAGAGTAYLRPDLIDRVLGSATDNPSADAGVVAAPPIDSARIADSIANFQRSALAFADSVARVDSIARADSLAVVAAANAARLAAARRNAPPTRPRPAATPPRQQAAAQDPPPQQAAPQQQAAPPPAVVETVRVVTPPPAPPPEPAAPTGPGSVRIGSRIPGAVLYVGDEVRPIGQRGVQTLTFPPGPVKISIRAENCASWDTTFTVVAAQTHTIGYRPTSC